MSGLESISVAVVGATGAVGEAMLDILADRIGAGDTVHAVASERSVGVQVSCGNRSLDVEVLEDFDFSGVDFALFSAGGSISAVHAPRAAEAGSIVIDNTSEFRYRDDIPLVVPEVNGDLLDAVEPGCIIANPNCSTIQMVVALAPIHRAAGIDRINVATYQSVSGAGRDAMEELARQTADRLNMKEVKPQAFKQPIAFNVLPEIDSMQDNGYTREEMKLHWETRKILGDDSIMVNATAVRVPVFFGHSEAVHFETRDEISIGEITRLLEEAPGVVIVAGQGGFATAVTHAAGKDSVYVSRLRRDLSHPRGVDMWVVADNVRKGAALNAIQIMDRIRGRSGGDA
ncbi:MAG: aspartate-semialdehyde dehydrogenase [Xanthomonadales bacterium]|nr:aspartate-semialdehyde dehydrogenase [Xanthomonadales bacterium]NIX12446.1 aspartate-semialdehyde dehydrogenase [Xanthomonadales bacterium]